MIMAKKYIYLFYLTGTWMLLFLSKSNFHKLHCIGLKFICVVIDTEYEVSPSLFTLQTWEPSQGADYEE